MGKSLTVMNMCIRLKKPNKVIKTKKLSTQLRKGDNPKVKAPFLKVEGQFLVGECLKLSALMKNMFAFRTSNGDISFTLWNPEGLMALRTFIITMCFPFFKASH